MCDLVAQSVEHRPFKAVVQGSNPCRVTIYFLKTYDFSRNQQKSDFSPILPHGKIFPGPPQTEKIDCMERVKPFFFKKNDKRNFLFGKLCYIVVF